MTLAIHSSIGHTQCLASSRVEFHMVNKKFGYSIQEKTRVERVSKTILVGVQIKEKSCRPRLVSKRRIAHRDILVFLIIKDWHLDWSIRKIKKSPILVSDYKIYSVHNTWKMSPKHEEGRPQWESNPRPSDPKSDALIHCAMRSHGWNLCFIYIIWAIIELIHFVKLQKLCI